MNPVEFLTRLIISFVLIIFLVLRWALGPYITGAHLPDGDFNSGLLSVFFGTVRAGEYTFVALFSMRAFIGMALVSWVLIPAARFFIDANFRYLQVAAIIGCLGAATVCFFLTLLIQLFYYGGGTIFA
ncbi:MAG: hypothetical protein HAW59_03755 [Betaproteobacteria bacterium]|nr:hypothetical protein [Betaproteobacteria bacterium]